MLLEGWAIYCLANWFYLQKMGDRRAQPVSLAIT